MVDNPTPPEEGDDHPEFRITEQYNDGTVYYGCDAVDADVFIEEVKVTKPRVERGDTPRGVHAGETYYSVGVFDRTIGSHPVVPCSTSQHRTRPRAVAAALSLAANLDTVLGKHRERDEYRKAIDLRERAPAIEQDGGPLPEYKLHQLQNRVYDGRITVEDAMDELRREGYLPADTTTD